MFGIRFTGIVRSLRCRLRHAHVPLRRIAQGSECGLVAGAVMGSDRLGEAVELDQYGALIYAGVND